MTPHVLIDASNLRVGGGVQVAASFLDEFVELRSTLPAWASQAEVWVSSAVHSSLSARTADSLGARVVDFYPRSPRSWWSGKPQFDLSFVVFGPEYRSPVARRRVVGYADGRSVFPLPLGEALSPQQRFRWRARGVVSRQLMKSADRIIVESESLAHHLVRRGVAPAGRVSVVSNSYNGIFDRPEDWLPVPPPAVRPGARVLSYVARGYPHKNHGFLDRVRLEAVRRGVELHFLVTLSEAEWGRLPVTLREVSTNYGVVPIAAVPSIGLQSEATIFPSLLETFSATPLEAMKLGRVVFASDREFVRSTAGEAPIYFDPLDPSQAADVICAALTSHEVMDKHRLLGREIVEALPFPRERAEAFVRILDEELRQ